MHKIYLYGFGALWRKRLEGMKQSISVCVSFGHLQVIIGGAERNYFQKLLVSSQCLGLPS